MAERWKKILNLFFPFKYQTTPSMHY